MKIKRLVTASLALAVVFAVGNISQANAKTQMQSKTQTASELLQK